MRLKFLARFSNSPLFSVNLILFRSLKKGPANGGVAAISRRSNVSENLADAIIGTEDVDDIADLLGNDSAQIREEALDDLINQSSNVELWHATILHCLID